MMKFLNTLLQVRFDEKGATIDDRILTIENPDTPTSLIQVIAKADSPNPAIRFLSGIRP